MQVTIYVFETLWNPGFYVTFLLFWRAHWGTHSPSWWSTDYYTAEGFRSNEKQFIIMILAPTIAFLLRKYFPLKLLLQNIRCMFNFILINSPTVFKGSLFKITAHISVLLLYTDVA